MKTHLTSETFWHNKVALITGAGSGIGSATAQAFARKGAQIVLTGRSEKPLTETAQAITTTGGKPPLVIPNCDAGRDDNMQQAIARTAHEYGRLDAALNLAGVEQAPTPLADLPTEEWDQIINTNLRGVFLSMKYEIPLMLKSGEGGAIINASSAMGMSAVSGVGAYCASKWGLIGLTKSAALDYAKQNIRINAICPGFVRTPMIERLVGTDEEALQTILKYEPIGRMAEPDELAAILLHLCSPEASFITGAAISADGGMTIGPLV